MPFGLSSFSSSTFFLCGVCKRIFGPYHGTYSAKGLEARLPVCDAPQQRSRGRRRGCGANVKPLSALEAGRLMKFALSVLKWSRQIVMRVVVCGTGGAFLPN